MTNDDVLRTTLCSWTKDKIQEVCKSLDVPDYNTKLSKNELVELIISDPYVSSIFMQSWVTAKPCRKPTRRKNRRSPGFVYP